MSDEVRKKYSKRLVLSIYPTDDNISWAYEKLANDKFAAKAHAFLAIAYNYKYNVRNFTGLGIKMHYQKSLLFEPVPKRIVEENGEIVKKEYTREEWIKDS